MHKLVLAMAVAVGIGMNNTFAYRPLIAIAPQLGAGGLKAGCLAIWLGAVRGTGTRLQCNWNVLASQYTAAVHTKY
jgi:hypothetical protein